MLSSPRGCPDMSSGYLLPGEAWGHSSSGLISSVQEHSSLCKMIHWEKAYMSWGLIYIKPSRAFFSHCRRDTARKCLGMLRRGVRWTRAQLRFHLCLYTFTLMSKRGASQQHPAIYREKKERRFSLKALHFFSSFTLQNILFISFWESASDIAGKQKMCFKRAQMYSFMRHIWIIQFAAINSLGFSK